MSDSDFMQLALDQAQLAMAQGEVPVGAVVVKDGHVVGAGFNNPIGRHDPSAHAEILALRAAAQQLGNYRLDGCELYVTLEPCAMCAGAMLHARVDRVIFAAADPKTGSAGSVLNLFSQPQLNHRTQVVGGVQASEGAALLHQFFHAKRQRRPEFPLADHALRTPPSCFSDLTEFAWPTQATNALASLHGLRLQYLDLGPPNAAQSVVALHGAGTWGYVYRDWIDTWLARGWRVLVPDLVGFGRSDKPKKSTWHSAATHRRILQEFTAMLGLQHFKLVLPQGDDFLNLASSGDWPNQAPEIDWLSVDTQTQAVHWSARQRLAYAAPFPDVGHKAALHPWPDQGGASGQVA